MENPTWDGNGMDIATLTVSVFATNCYLVYDKVAGEGIIIDPGDEGEWIIDEADRREFAPKAIVLTHGHGDHIGAVDQVKAKFDVPVIAGAEAEKMITISNDEFSAAYGVPISCPMPDRLLSDGETISFGTEELRVISTPGHSPEGICLYSNGILFCGDTLFAGSVGRTDLPGGDHRRLIDSIRQKLLPLPDETVCYTGHGPTTTIGVERRYNPFLLGDGFD